MAITQNRGDPANAQAAVSIECMKTVSFEELIAQGRESASANEPWHFHVIKDSCELLERDVEVLFVLEHGSPAIAIAAPGTMAVIENVAELAELLHRVSTTPDSASDGSTSSLAPGLNALLVRAQQFTEHHVAWHHHVLYPNCLLNTNPGSWNILVEGDGETLSASATSEPTPLLRQLEPLFYAQSGR